MFDDMMKKANGHLIIVCSNENTEKYGDFLKRLINAGEKTPISVVVWSEKHYRDNKAQIASITDRILFVGYGKESSGLIDTVEVSYHKCGMRYAVIGNQSVTYVNKHELNGEDYQVLREVFNSYKTKFKEKSGVNLEDLDWARKKKMDFKGLEYAFLPLNVVKLAHNMKSKDKEYKETRNQQYLCLMLVWYIDAFKEFMGIKDE